jgi:hypothetical protein
MIWRMWLGAIMAAQKVNLPRPSDAVAASALTGAPPGTYVPHVRYQTVAGISLEHRRQRDPTDCP